MSNRLSRLRDCSDLVFKKAPRSIDVFIVIKNSDKSDDVRYVTKSHVERALKTGYKKVVLFDEDGSTILAINYLDNA